MLRPLYRLLVYLLVFAFLLTALPREAIQAQFAHSNPSPAAAAAPWSAPADTATPIPPALTQTPPPDASASPVPAVTPLPVPHLPSLVPQADLAPDTVSVGDELTLTVTLRNQAPDPAVSLVITVPVPAGTHAEPANLEYWSWTLPQLDSGAGATFTATMRVVENRPGGAILVEGQALAQGLDTTVPINAGALLVPPGRGPTQARFIPGHPTVLHSSDGQVDITIPAAAYTQPLTLQHRFDRPPGQPQPARHAGRHRDFGTFYLQAADDDGQAVHQFSVPLTITVHYTLDQLTALGIGESDLTLFWYNEEDPAGAAWEPMTTQVDPATHTATVQVDHFTAFQFGDGSSPSTAFIPSLQGWQVGLYNGGVSYSYPIEVPAGPAGIKPSLALSYNSTATDSSDQPRRFAQDGWVGKGWSLDVPYIAANKLGTSYEDTHYYTLVLNGQSYDLMRGGLLDNHRSTELTDPSNWDWRATDESFLRVRAEVNSQGPTHGDPGHPDRGGWRNGIAYDRYIWQVWTADGTRYDFAEDLWDGWLGSDCYDDSHTYLETYKWYLTQVEDTNGNRITYSYYRTSGWSSGHCDLSGTMDSDEGLKSITWGGKNADPDLSGPDRYQVITQAAGRNMA